jgi:methanogenic corrinoid protein MtbC1
LGNFGEAWAQGKISVTQEHRASAIVGRVISSLNERFIRPTLSKGRAIVTTLAYERHELGAWVLADMLEHDGWGVHYLGANATETTIFDALLRFKPHLLALSITMYLSVEFARQIISRIRESEIIMPPAVLVGGFAVNSRPAIWKEIGAHGYAEDVEKALIFANSWWNKLPTEQRLK